jgi:WD40 repeat protein
MNCLNASVNKRALVIGIQIYPFYAESNRLKYADSDAKAFVSFLKSVEGGEFQDDDIQLLLNEQATRKEIFSAIRKLSLGPETDDIVYIFIAGHSQQDDLGRVFLMPFDADPKIPEAFGIRADEFMREVRSRIGSRRLVFFIDTCYAAAFLNDNGASRSGEQNLQELWKQEIKSADSSTIAFLSATANQRSREADSLRHGIFTNYVLSGLRGDADSNNDGIVRAGELYTYLIDNVPKYSLKTFQTNQTPIINPQFDETLALSRPGKRNMSNYFLPYISKPMLQAPQNLRTVNMIYGTSESEDFGRFFIDSNNQCNKSLQVAASNISIDGAWVAFTPKNKRYIRLLNIGKETARTTSFDEEETGAWPIAVASGGKAVVWIARRADSSLMAEPLRIWRPDIDKTQKLASGIKGGEFYIAFDIRGDLFALGGINGEISILQTNGVIPNRYTSKADIECVTAIAFSRESKYLAVGGSSGIIAIYDLNKGKWLKNTFKHDGSITALEFGLDEKDLVSGTSTGEIYFWNVSSGNLNKVIKGHDGFIASLALSPFGKEIASGGSDGSFKIWDLGTHNQIDVNNTRSYSSPKALLVRFASDGRLIGIAPDKASP